MKKLSRIWYFYVAICLFISFIGYSCKNNQNSFKVKGEIAIHIKTKNKIDLRHILATFKIFSNNDSSFLYYLNPDFSEINYILLNDSTYRFNLINLSQIKKLFEIDKSTDITFISKDSILLFTQNSQELAIINFHGELLSKIVLPSSPNVNTRYEIDNLKEVNYFAQSYFNSNLIFFNKKMYVQVAYKDIFLKEKESFINYFNRKSQLRVDIQKYTLAGSINFTSLFANFPQNYRLGNFYGDFHSYRTVVKNNIVVSFPFSDTIYIYSDTNILKKVCFSPSKKPNFLPSDLSKTTDLAYQLKHKIESPYYEGLYYDQYREVFYRILKEKASYNENNKMIRRETNLNWTLIIYSKDFQYLKEVEMDPKIFSSYRLFSLKDNILFMAPIDSCLKSESIKLKITQL